MTNATYTHSNTKKSVGVPPTPSKAHQRANGKKIFSQVKKDVKQEITDRIIELMEAGTERWVKTWKGAVIKGFPKNAITKQKYNGINVFLLWLHGANQGYASNQWLTYKQAQSIGANVIKGEKSVTCVFFDMVKKKEPKEGEAEYYPMAKKFFLFNIEQIENLPEDFIEVEEEIKIENNFIRNEEAEAFLKATKANIKNNNGDRAYYSPSNDLIVLPMPEAFTTTGDYYATAAHELVHWTGHKERLDRDFSKSTRFGDSHYAFEELVAELGSAYLSAQFGFLEGTIENHASYLDHWIKVLKDDKNAIFTAAKHASNAFDYLSEITSN